MTMSIYVKNLINLILEDDGWSNNKVNLLEGLLEYPNLTIEDLEYIWNNAPIITNGHMDQILIHPLVTFEWLNHVGIGINWQKVVCNPNVTTETVEKYPTSEWNWWHMHLVKGLTIEFVLKHMNKRWNWEELSMVITIEDYLMLHYEFGLLIYNYNISSNDNITIQHVIDNPKIEWCAKDLLRNPSIQKDLNLGILLQNANANANANGTKLFKNLLKLYVAEQQFGEDDATIA